MKRLLATAALAVVAATLPSGARAAERWTEIRTPNFTVWSNARDGDTRTLAWQLEQIRSAIGAIWPGARTELTKPILVLVVRDEASMKTLAPAFWERRGGVRPTSVWVSGADQHYLVLRGDVRGDDRDTITPHTTAYFSYASLVVQGTYGGDVPLWFSRGLAGVLSNTLVRESHVLVGAPIPWHLQQLADSRLTLTQLVGVTRLSQEYTQGDRLVRLDATAWGFVHYLMFGDNGAYRERFERYASRLRRGERGAEVLEETLGPVEKYEDGFTGYIGRRVYSFGKAQVDASVERQRFPSRAIPEAEALAGLAAYHVNMRRPEEARAAVASARKVDPDVADAFLAEALQHDVEGRVDEARTAYAHAVGRGSTSAYAYFRHAMLRWQRQLPQAELEEVERALARATELNPRFASAYSALGEVRALLGRSTAVVMPTLARAVELEPNEAWPRIAFARTLARLKSYDEARKTANAALRLATTDEEREAIRELLTALDRLAAGGTP